MIDAGKTEISHVTERCTPSARRRMNQVMGKITASHVCGGLTTLWKSFNHVTSLLGESIQLSISENTSSPLNLRKRHPCCSSSVCLLLSWAIWYGVLWNFPPSSSMAV